MQTAADRDANIIFGAVIDESQDDEVSVTVIGTGFQHQGRLRSARSERADEGGDRDRSRRRDPDRGRGQVEIRDEDIDVPPFLR